MNKIKNSSIHISLFDLKLIHKIFDTVNVCFLLLIFVLSFLSLNSQRKWTNTYRILNETKAYNNNLIDYISKTEEFYISELETLNTLKKTTPKDLIYLEKILEKDETFFIKKIKIILDGLEDSRYQRGF